MKNLYIIASLFFIVSIMNAEASIEGYMELSSAIDKISKTKIQKLLPLYRDKLTDEQKVNLLAKAHNNYEDLKNINEKLKIMLLVSPMDIISPIIKGGLYICFGGRVFWEQLLPFTDQANRNFEHFYKKLFILGISGWFFKEGIKETKFFLNFILKSIKQMNSKNAEEIKLILEQAFK